MSVFNYTDNTYSDYSRHTVVPITDGNLDEIVDLLRTLGNGYNGELELQVAYAYDRKGHLTYGDMGDHNSYRGRDQDFEARLVLRQTQVYGPSNEKQAFDRILEIANEAHDAKVEAERQAKLAELDAETQAAEAKLEELRRQRASLTEEK